MKKFRFLTLLVLAIGIFSACEKMTDQPGPQGDLKDSRLKTLELLSCIPDGGSVDLMAGQNNIVGNVTVEQDGDNLIVTYNIAEDGYLMTETHLAVEESLNGIPHNKSGNPTIGQFEFSDSHNPGVTTFSYTVDITGFENVVIAAHAVVKNCYEYPVEMILPTSLVTVQLKLIWEPSSFLITISGTGTWLDEIWPGYCVDPYRGVLPTSAYIVSSLSDNAAVLSCLVDKPENLDLVNYLLNQDYKTKFGADAGDIQYVLWALLDDNPPTTNPFNGLSWNQTIVDAIIADVNQYGEGFIPGCDEVVALFIDPGCSNPLSPSLGDYQPTIIIVPMECESECDSETAWGFGNPFPGSSWAMYFTYCW